MMKPTWKQIDSMPRDVKVLVFNHLYGVKIMELTQGGDWYDDNEIYDDSGIEWDFWAELPPPPDTIS